MQKKKTTIPLFLAILAMAGYNAFRPEQTFWFKATSTGNDCFENGQMENADIQLTGALHDVQAHDPKSSKLVTSLINEGFLKTVEKQSAQAQDFFTQASKIIEAEGSDSSRKTDQAAHLTSLADAYSLSDQYDLARPIYLRALDLATKINGADSAQVASTANNLADMYCRRKNYTEAEALYKQSLAIRRRQSDSIPAEYCISTMEGLAACLGKQEKYDEAEGILQDAIALNSKGKAVNLTRLASEYRSLAKVFEARKNFSQAEIAYKSALKVLQLIAASADEKVALDPDTPPAIPLYKQSTATCDRLLAPVCPTAKEMQAGADRCLASKDQSK